ncbi:MAG: hypothetical protein DRJ43_01610 [Thermoprotei archaeon]|nr:MAG: hypothetical protein DRJ43_01610 [Thermoprotei archaeon]
MILLLATYAVALVAAVAGLLTYVKASRTPPNTRLGFRAAPALVSKRVWVKVNRVVGVAAVVDAALVIPLSLLLDELSLFMYMVSSLTILEGAAALYSRAILEREAGLEPGGETPVRKLPTIEVSLKVVATAFAVMLAAQVALLGVREILPKEVAVHFNFSGEPDAYMDRDSFIALFSLLYLILVGTLSLLLLSCRGVPLIPEFKGYQERLESVLSHALVAVSTLMPGVLLIIVHYNLYGRHPVNSSLATLILLGTSLATLLIGLVKRSTN